MNIVKSFGLVAHDHMKNELIDWALTNWETIYKHRLTCTGTTGRLVEEALRKKLIENKIDPKILNINCLKSGPLGGDQQLGALISENKIDILVFFWDPMLPQPHEVDVKALLRIAVVYNIPVANNRSTADFLVTSCYFSQSYTPKTKDFSAYLNRTL